MSDIKSYILGWYENAPEDVKRRVHLVDGKTYTTSEIISEIQKDSEFGKKMLKAIEKVISR